MEQDSPANKKFALIQITCDKDVRVVATEKIQKTKKDPILDYVKEWKVGILRGKAKNERNFNCTILLLSSNSLDEKKPESLGTNHELFLVYR